MSQTCCREFTVRMDAGLHLRSAALMVKTVRGFDAQIAISNGEITVDGKSFLSLAVMSAPKGTVLRVLAEGPDANGLIDAIGGLFDCGFGETCDGLGMGPPTLESVPPR